MLKKLPLIAAIFAVIAAPSFAADPVVAIGQPAPDFTAKAADGADISLTNLKGKTVVLEWTNDGCPFVHKHYDSGNMQKLQKEATADGVVWLSVVSSAEGKQGYVTPAEAQKLTADRNASPTHVLLDSTGALGRLYHAKTTPHMFVIDKTGTLVYEGGIDDKPTPVPASLDGANNYVRTALADLKAGKPVATPQSKPYGCSIKYAE